MRISMFGMRPNHGFGISLGWCEMRENPLLFRSEQEMGLYPLKTQNKTLKSTNTNLLNQLLFNTSFQKSASLAIKSFLNFFFLDKILPGGDFVLTEHENDFLPCQSNCDNRAAVARSSRGSNTKMFHSILFLVKDTKVLKEVTQHFALISYFRCSTLLAQGIFVMCTTWSVLAPWIWS